MFQLKKIGLIFFWSLIQTSLCFSEGLDKYPSRPIKLVVPVEPGGGMDLFARSLALDLGGKLNVPVAVINKSGAQGLIGTNFVKESKNDGYTFLLTGVTHIVLPLTNGKLSTYHPVKSFTPIAKLAVSPNVLVANMADYDGNRKKLIVDIQNHPTKYAIGSGGGTNLILGELFKKRLKVDLLTVPYAGSSHALQGLIKGDVQLLFLASSSLNVALMYPQIKPVVVFDDSRLKSHPDIPTFKELGFQKIVFNQWYGILGPAGISEEVEQIFTQTISEIANDKKSHLNSYVLNNYLTIDIVKLNYFANFLNLEFENLKKINFDIK